MQALGEVLDKRMAYAAAAPFHLALVDLDGFKQVNDVHGHALGDAVLVEVAQRLSYYLRHEDTVARLGGDEFVIILRNVIDPNMAETVANTLLSKLIEPIQALGHRLTVSASIGCASYPQDGLDNSTLLKIYALYKQASSGDVDGKRPGFGDMVGRAKWDAWDAIKGTSKDDAMQQYIDLIESLS